ncbi:hypothetical protein OC861_007053, partial [Tilletia horrida]
MIKLLALAETALAPQEGTWDPPNPNQTTPWARRHRFMTTLEGEDLKAYAGMISTKNLNAEETEIVKLAESSIKAAATRLNEYPIYFAQLLNSKDVTKVESTRPMNAKPSTLQGYIKVLEQMVIFYWRAWKLGRVSEPPADRPQHQGLTKVVKAVAKDLILVNHLENISLKPTSRSIWAIGEHILTSSMGSTADASPLAIFLAAIGIETPVNGNFKDAGAYTPLLSRLLYTLRLCFFASHITQLEDLQTEIAEVGEEEQLDLAEEMAEAHRRSLGADSKMSSGSRFIQGLRTFGMASAKAQGGRDQALWSQDGKNVMMAGNLLQLEK